MVIFYGEAQARPNVSADSAAEEPFETVLAIFRSLDRRKGFMGIVLNSSFVLQLLPGRQRVRIELLDKSRPAIDFCEAENAVAEKLIKAASEGADVFQTARLMVSEWKHMEL